MKKFVKILSLVLCLVLCLSLFACAGKTTTNQDGNKIPENPGGTGDNNKPINLLDYFYETFEDTVYQGISSQVSGNLAPLLDNVKFNEPIPTVYIKTKIQVFIESITLDIAYNGKLTESFYFTYTNYNYDDNDVRKTLDMNCATNLPVTYTFAINKQFIADTIIILDIFTDDNYDKDTNPMYMDNLRIKLKLN